MKKKLVIAVAVITVIIATIVAWRIAYDNHKSNDNLPRLTRIATDFSPEEANSLLKGYLRNQLQYMWGDPAEQQETIDIWHIDEITSLIITYNKKDKVVSARIEKVE